MNRPKTTLYMLVSVDGKISTGSSDLLDFDKDLPKIDGVKEGLQQYYDIEKTTDIFSFNTGRVMSKIGLNERADKPIKMPVTFVIVDNKPHLTESGIRYLLAWTKRLILVTTDKSHPAKAIDDKNLFVIEYENDIDFDDLFEKLSVDFGAKRMTIQSGGEMNAKLIRANLVDRVSIVVAPLIVGGRSTSTLVDGDSLQKLSDLSLLRPLELTKVNKLKNSYIQLIYKFIPIN